MKREDYFLKNILVEVLRNTGAQFKDKATGKNEDNEIIKDLLKDGKIKDKFYMALENELIKALEEKYPELKGSC